MRQKRQISRTIATRGDVNEKGETVSIDNIFCSLGVALEGVKVIT